MPKTSQKPRLVINAQDLDVLETLKRSRTAPKARVERASMLLRYREGARVSDIAREFGTNRPKVERLINKALQFGALGALDDLPRSGKPETITPEARAYLLSVACQKPKDLGYEHELWTMSLLAKHLRQHGPEHGYACLANIAKGTVSKILARHDIRPHKVRYYVERRDPEFEQKMANVLCVYREVAMLRTEDHFTTAYISYDEKPGIQAIESTSKDLPPVPGKHSCISRDYEYVRHGTLSLLAGINLVTGHITALVHERHRSAEFIEFLQALDEQYSELDKIRIILDNHSSHTSKETQRYLATVPNRFEFVFTPKHGSWLNIIESLFGKLARTVLRGIRVSGKAELAERILAHIDKLNEEPVVFKWTYKTDMEDII